jgi:hypothetical protein
MNVMEHPVTQGSEAWLKLRLGRPTASEFDQLLTPEFKVRTGQMPQSYLCRKLAEYFTGKPLEDFGSFAMEQGSILEGEAVPWFEFVHGVKVRRMGFVTDEAMRYGCSPDGLIGDDDGLEVKCPRPQTHVQYLLDGVVPKDYLCQVHGCMYVTGRPRWTFLSYSRHFPALVVKVERDEVIQEAIKVALDLFLGKFAACVEKIEAMQNIKP